jgi:integrase
VRITGLEPVRLTALPPQSSVSANSTISESIVNKGEYERATGENDSVLTSVLTGSGKRRQNRRFQRAGHQLFRFRKTGMLYGVFKSAGKTRWKSLGTDDLIRARELLAEEIKRDTKVDWKQSRTVTLRQLIEHCENNPMQLADSTFKIRSLLLDIFKATWAYGLGLRVREIKPFMLRSWLAGQRKERRLKTAGVNNYVRMLHGLFELAVDHGAVSENIASQLQLKREENPDRLTPPWDQALQIVETVKSVKSKMALSAMLLFGLGQGELRNLYGEHFDLKQNLISIRRQKTQKVFVIPIYPHAYSFVRKLQGEGWITNGQRVFPICNPREAIACACRRLRFPSFSPRSFRRAFIVRALEKGVDPRVVATWQGHRDATLILRVYGAWVNKDHARRMTALMN